MKTNRINNIIGNLDDDLIAEAATSGVAAAEKLPAVASSGAVKPAAGTTAAANPAATRRPAWLFRAAAVACFCLAVAGIAWATGLLSPGKAPTPEDNVGYDFTSITEDTVINYVIHFSPETEIGQYKATYKEIGHGATGKIGGTAALFGVDVTLEELGNYLGEAAFDGEDGSDWFRIKGRQDLQYVISRKDGSYHLWEFFRFDLDKKHPFADVMKYVYNLSSADDISEIVVKPSLRDNTTAGKEIQKQIGVHSITDRATIERFYGLLTQVSLTDTTGIFDAGPESFKAERYLEIKTKDGRTIDPLKYEGIGGRFFEFGGLVYSPLADADRAWLAQLFSINYNPAALQPTATPTPKP
ncbi:MAG: hypothetical protein K6E71_08045 [Lachnospiraceae bacterium]|nr:hypothetical protein [Lachnospiraceae bacterium]